MPNTKRGFGSAGLILVILLILGGGAYLWSQKKVEAPAPTNIPDNNSFKTLPAPDETANWKTYKNEEYGFEFKYPENFSEITSNSRSDGEFDSSCLDRQINKNGCRALFSARLSGGDNYAYGFDVFVLDKNKVVISNLNPNLFEKGNMVFFLSLSGTNPSVDMVDAYNQILSTFRFTK